MSGKIAFVDQSLKTGPSKKLLSCDAVYGYRQSISKAVAFGVGTGGLS
jgi:hypothetical protein